MIFEAGTVVTLVIAGAGLAATWGALSVRIRSLEARSAAVDELRKVVDGLAATFDAVRTDQGRRIGKAQSDADILQGRIDGFQSGFGAGRRSRTAAHGTAQKETP